MTSNIHDISLKCDPTSRELPSFPTRRSSDLGVVQRIMPCQGVQKKGCIGYTSGNRAHGVERGGIGHKAVSGDPAVGGFHSYHPAVGCRLTNGASGIGTQSRMTHSGCHGCCASTARSACNVLLVYRISGGTMNRILCGGTHGKFIHVGSPDQEGICLL